MLVLSRREKETLVFPGLNIEIEILRAQQNRVRVGVSAPKDVQIIRGELLKDGKVSSIASFKSLKRSGSNQAPQTQATLANDAPHNIPTRQVAGILNQLELLAQEHDWGKAEPQVESLFRKLQTLDTGATQLDPPKAIQADATDRKKRALLVDDNENESRLLASYLSLKGFEVDRVDNGKTAMIHLGNGLEPDAVLLDMCMPRFDGRWTISQIRQNIRLSDTRVYAISGLDQTASGVEIGPQGVNEWFTKPLNPEELIEAISSDFVATAV